MGEMRFGAIALTDITPRPRLELVNVGVSSDVPRLEVIRCRNWTRKHAIRLRDERTALPWLHSHSSECSIYGSERLPQFEQAGLQTSGRNFPATSKGCLKSPSENGVLSSGIHKHNYRDKYQIGHPSCEWATSAWGMLL
jgi:hypothetical protein